MANFIKLASFDLTMTGSAINLKGTSSWDFAKDVILRSDSGNAADDIKIGDVNGQSYPLPKAGPDLNVGTITNRMSQSAKFDLKNIFVSGTAGGKLHVLLVDPSATGQIED
jgi:hypothetical protein